jgi:hypothetical protein
VSGPIETVADSIRGAFAERAKAVAA